MIAPRRTVAAALSVVAATAGLVTLTSPSASAQPQPGDCGVGLVEAVGTGGGSLGYLRVSSSTGVGTLVERGEIDRATRFVLPAGPRGELVVQDTGKVVGLVAGFNGPTLAAGSNAYALATYTSSTPAGAVPTQGTAGWTPARPPAAYPLVESHVWTLDDNGGLTATWINPDGQPAPSLFSSSLGNLVVTGDVDALAAFVQNIQYPPVTLRAVSCTSYRQVITFNDAPSSGLVGDTSTLSATGGHSGLPVTFTSATPTVCSVSDATVTYLKKGTCRVLADQAAGSIWTAAPQKAIEIPVARKTQSVTITSTAPTRPVPGDIYAVTTSGDEGTTPVLVSANRNICSVSGKTVTMVRYGTCVVRARLLGNREFAASPWTEQRFVVAKKPAKVTVQQGASTT